MKSDARGFLENIYFFIIIFLFSLEKNIFIYGVFFLFSLENQILRLIFLFSLFS